MLFTAIHNSQAVIERLDMSCDMEIYDMIVILLC